MSERLPGRFWLEALEDRTLLSFNFPDFSTLAGLQLNGDAAQVGSVLRLAPTGLGREGAGSAWYTTKQAVAQGFDTSFSFQISGVADGFAFVVQNDSAAALGGTGGDLGFGNGFASGIPDSIAVEFDLIQNGDDPLEPPDNHISVQTRGTLPNSRFEQFSIGSTVVASPRFNDGAVHQGKISYHDNTLSIYVDDLATPRLSVSVVLGSLLSLDTGQAFAGFTAGVGAESANHDILNWSFTESSIDIDMQSARLQDTRTVQFTYQTTGNPGSFQVGLYQSADGTTYDANAPLNTGTTTPGAPGSPVTGTIGIPDGFAADPARPYLIVAADPNNMLHEPNRDNNQADFRLPDLVPSLASGAIHHLIYRGQSLSVPLIVNNQGGDATGNINIEYYLSTSQNGSVDGPGNYLLKTDTIDAATLPVGQAYSPTPVVTIPSFIVKDTYYLKVRIIGASTNPTLESDTSNNVAVSEPLWVCSETNTMSGVRASVYEEAVSNAKQMPLDPNAVFDVDAVAKSKIKAAEELILYPYVDSEGIPTIGWGMALQYKDKHGNIVDNPVAKQRIKDANLVYPDDGPVAKLRGKKLNFNDILDLAHLWKQDRSTAVNIITPELAEVWFNSDYDAAKARVAADGIDLAKYTRYAQVALIDFYFNAGNLSAYPQAYEAIRAYATASAEDKPHLMACAAFEILDSNRTDQIVGTSRDRLVEMFRYFVAGYESVL